MPSLASRSASLDKKLAWAAALFVTLTCTGTAYGQGATLTPTPSQDFGSVVVGQSSAPFTFIFKNNSGATESVSSVILSNPGEFAQQSGPVLTTCPTIVVSNGSCTINIVFSPSATGPRSSTLTVNSNDATNPVLTVSLTGTGVAATTTATLTPSGTVTFPSTTVGSSSPSTQFTLTDTGNTAIGNIAPGVSGDFAVTPINCPASPATLAPGANCNINVVFSPSAPGTRTGTLTVQSTSSSNPLTVSLTGNGVPPVTGLVLSTNALSLGSYEVGAGTSPTMPVTLTNDDPGTITFTAPFGAGGDAFPVAGNFSQSNTCAQTLASGATCTANISFAPTATGTRIGSLTVQSNASNGTQTLTLSGNGTDYAVSTTTPSVTVVQGSTATYRITFTPISGYSNTITMGCTGLTAAGASCAGNGTAFLGPATTVNFKVTTTPKNIGGIVANGLAPGGPTSHATASHATGWISAFGLLLLAFAGRTRRLAQAAGLLALLLGLLWPTGGCSGKQPTPDPNATVPGTYTFTLTATDPLQLQPKTLTLTLVVTGQ